MALKSTFQAGDPLPAEDVNDMTKAIVQNEHNIFELFLENFFSSKVTPVNGIFFDGFSDSTKVDILSIIELDTVNRRLQFPSPSLGSGSDGALVTATTTKVDTIKKGITSAAAAGQKDVIVSDGSVYTAGKIVLLHQTQGTGAGNFEFAKIASIATNTLTMEDTLLNAYASSGAQVIQMKEFTSVTVNSGGIITADAWDGTVGGIIVFLCTGAITVNTGGTMTADALGFVGGVGRQGFGARADQGESELGLGTNTSSPNGSGGGGGSGASSPSTGSGSGGGGGHSVAGGAGDRTGSGGAGQAGLAVGFTDLSKIFFGGGGGGSASGNGAGDAPFTFATGGTSSGLIIVIANDLTMAGGTITANGGAGGNAGIGAGGGAGGAILLKVVNDITLDTTKITALGGAGGTGSRVGGSGAKGRIANNTDFEGILTGTTNPAINDNLTLEDILNITETNASGTYESIKTEFQQSKETTRLWLVRNFLSQFNLAAGISAGATTLTISGNKTGDFANGDTIDISTSTNGIRERKTLTATPSFAAGVTTLTFSATTNAFTTSAFVERVDVLPTISLVNSGAAKSFSAPTFVQSIVDFTNSEVEDEYLLTSSPAEEDLKIKITITRNNTGKRPLAKRLGVVLNE